MPRVAELPMPSCAIHVARPVPPEENATVGLSTNWWALDTLTGSDHGGAAAAGVAITRSIRVVSSARTCGETRGSPGVARVRRLSAASGTARQPTPPLTRVAGFTNHGDQPE